MKKILLACGTGICTSTAAKAKVSEILDENGYAGQYKINQCKISEAVSMSENYDFLIATTIEPKELKCPFVPGVCFMTGIGTEESIKQILELMEK